MYYAEEEQIRVMHAGRTYLLVAAHWSVCLSRRIFVILKNNTQARASSYQRSLSGALAAIDPCLLDSVPGKLCGAV